MDTSSDYYLHKKFKKQLSVDVKPRQHDKENENQIGVVEPSEEKTPPNERLNQNWDNKVVVVVPNQSTNNPPGPDVFQSSISTSERESSNPCISSDVATSRDPENLRISSFDTPFIRTIQSSSITESSSVDGYAVYYNNRSSPPLTEEYEVKQGETMATPEKNSSAGGKYVCTYCNLVCSKPSVLQKHIRAHTNERPYPCTSCGFSFKTRSNLYKHCRSRTHANRVNGNKAQEGAEPPDHQAPKPQNYIDNATQTQEGGLKNKPYKPRFHQVQFAEYEGMEEDARPLTGTALSHHINEIINKNNSIVNSNDVTLLKKRADSVNNNADEPLNLTNKNRKRCMSEVAEPAVIQKSLIKELLLKNLYSDMQCPYCKMIFQTVTELELHKLRSCKDKPSETKYARSSSVNVASILTKNKNAFDSMPRFQNAIFPLNSPGPFLGKTRLVESDKSKSFSFDAVNLPLSGETTSPSYLLSPAALPFKEEKRAPVKLFGGEVKIHSGGGESKSYRIDGGKEDKQGSGSGFVDYDTKLSENRVVKSSLQSGGTVLTNKSNKEEPRVMRDVIRVYENTSVSPNIDMTNLGKPHFTYDHHQRKELSSTTSEPIRELPSPSHKYPNIADFSQNAVKMLTPNIKQPTINIGELMPRNLVPYPANAAGEVEPERRSPFQVVANKRSVIQKHSEYAPLANNIYNPMNVLVNGKVFRYVPGMPGPVAAEVPMEMTTYGSNIVVVKKVLNEVRSPTVVEKPAPPVPENNILPLAEKPPPAAASPKKVVQKLEPAKEPIKDSPGEQKKFARPNSLALKPTTASLKQHHGLTPTIFNQILISPDTPRVDKKYAQHLFNGNYFSYLGLKSSTKSVYCTLNKTQPFYVPHFKKLSMYSEWRQQDNKADKLYVGAYDSRQRNQRYTTAGRTSADLIIHSSYKFVVSELPSQTSDNSEASQKSSIIGGYECNEDSPYVRGRGRGRYVCEQCGIRCKKPSMLKKHIRTHSNDRPYTCSHCNFSFKTKGNLTKHMKSKSHTKNSTSTGNGSSCSSSAQLSGASDSSDTEDSGMDSSDESMTRHQEHEAAYGLLSLSQKSPSPRSPSGDQFMTTEEIAHVSQTNYAKNKMMDNPDFKLSKEIPDNIPEDMDVEQESLSNVLGKSSANRPLTYPYSSVVEEPVEEPKSIRQFQVIQKYAGPREPPPVSVPTIKLNDLVIEDVPMEKKRKIAVVEPISCPKNDEVMDLSMSTNQRRDQPQGTRTVYTRQEAYYSSPEHREPSPKLVDYDNSAMETLAEVATNQVKLEKNTLAKNVASEFLKLATQNENPTNHKDVVNDLIVKPEGNKSCTICSKSFNKPFQLRLHMNIHYLERPFRCDSCSVSFRTKGHLQKHERSASHYSKLSSSPAQSSSEPRPFKCSDCNIAFRIHGHLAKHLRSKMHIMKLECLKKIPFGLYAELERSNSLLTEINTTDGDQCLESLKTLATKVFLNDPSKLQTLHVEAGMPIEPDS